MPAYTVTGRGQGSAHPGQTGPGNNRNKFKPLTSPQIVAAGVKLDVDGAQEVSLPGPLPMAAGNYMVLLTADTADADPIVTDMSDNADGQMVSFEVTTALEADVNWAVVQRLV